MGKGERPEHMAPPDIFYNADEARKYTTNSRMIAIQSSLTERALELLALPQDGIPRLLLDLGCGSGLSGETLSEAGHMWLGVDISEAMLDVAVEREIEGDLVLGDLGHGLPLRPGAFDGAISISAVQWLCNADRTGHDPRKRMKRFFETLYMSLRRGARAVLQIYPENPQQAEMLVAAAMKVGFSGGLVVDYPHSTRAKKYFLVLMVGTSAATPQAKGLDGSEPEDEEEEAQVKVAGRDRHKRRKTAGGGSGSGTKGREWILKKKEQMRKKGYDIAADSKYTGRKRKRLV
ncbi:hypothetical protein VOLCADRAFT_103561 [Volvox carteri f. nagariensis]|uniref:Methyltransferase type 11 domain-containing protein n=1 Tax=Volvox carteri f. nagariensis TaxID=3068 RepID=D8TMT4_VOLCA|nr:uncharacterized protein VOLCADRAFT_103561 [Volvox carteri f. nagariensis]EFJ51182.1 hypothetical protein VOLCADRAFT_103561 [Volvox carteri f. nagariensis]|eukprot:XP_002947649.1 hypothetical protein VOLCADRAFT_103561 [Volvox carteri f. nagariensis]